MASSPASNKRKAADETKTDKPRMVVNGYEREGDPKFADARSRMLACGYKCEGAWEWNCPNIGVWRVLVRATSGCSFAACRDLPAAAWRRHGDRGDPLREGAVRVDRERVLPDLLRGRRTQGARARLRARPGAAAARARLRRALHYRRRRRDALQLAERARRAERVHAARGGRHHRSAVRDAARAVRRQGARHPIPRGARSCGLARPARSWNGRTNRHEDKHMPFVVFTLAR